MLRRARIEVRWPVGYVPAALTAVLSSAAFAAWLLSDLGSPVVRVLVGDVVYVAAPLVAALACRAAHRRSGLSHGPWWWIGLGCLTWAAGSVYFGGHHLLTGTVPSLPSPADVAYVGYTVPVAVGLLSFKGRRPTLWSRWRAGLDALSIGGCLLLTGVELVLDPVLEAAGAGMVHVVALSYPVSGVLVTSIVLARSVLLPDVRRLVWLPLSLGLLLLAVTDGAYVVGSLAGEFAPGGMLDLGWFAAFVLVAVAAAGSPTADVAELVPSSPGANRPEVCGPGRSGPGENGPGGPAPGPQEVPGFLRQLFPAAALGLAVLTVASQPEFLTKSGHQHGWLLAAVGVVVVIRQLVLVADQTALATDLSRAVEARTLELRHREQWWRDIVQNLTDVVIVTDREGVVAYCSPAADNALGHLPALTSTAELLAQVHPEEAAAVAAELADVVAGDRARGFVECRVRRGDGRYGWFEVEAVGQLRGLAVDGAVLTLHDVSERRELTDRLHRRAYHDMLTGLPNRALLLQRIQQTLRLGPRPAFGLLLLDLDDFKIINDRHGHAAGDIVLTVIAERLAALVGAGDTVARLGGDEFAQLVHGTAEQIRALAERLVEAIEQPVVAGGRRFHVRTSIGVVLAAESGAETAQVLLSHADIALYEAKGRDKGGIVVLEGDSRQHAARQVLLREQIAKPDLEQFPVVYQPIVDLATGELRGAEALLRWQHPVVGAVPPEVFIPLAEAGGSIQALGWHVLTQACRQLADWHRLMPERRFAVGVNVSVRQLDEPGFAHRVALLVAEHGLAPDQLVLELTEQSLAVDFETAVAVVAQLRATGISVAVDDYGTGYSSLRYLDRFDADVVKIDRGFVANVVDSGHTQKIVRSVMHMARSLDLQSIAEGIETAEQLAVVQTLGCELGQGFLFSRPVPPEEMTRLMLDPPRWPGFDPLVLLASG